MNWNSRTRLDAVAGYWIVSRLFLSCVRPICRGASYSTPFRHPLES